MRESREARVIGVDLGGTNIKAAAITKTGQVVTKVEWATEADKGVEHVINRLQKIAYTVAEEAGWNWAEVTGMGIGLPGFLNFRTGVVEQAVNLGWKNTAIISVLSESMGIPVYFDNDANAAAIGEAWVGGGQGFDHVAVATIGTGIGGGFIINGHIVRGANGMVGEIGHLLMEREHGRLCNCGKHGCLETISSATAMLRSAREAVREGAQTTLSQFALDSLTTRDVIDAARLDDKVAYAIVKQAMETLGIALSHIGNTLNPQRIVIGGGVSKAGEIIFEFIRKGFEQGALPRVIEACQIVPAKLGNDAGVIGAAKLALEA
ncbi:ROK family glucokinase [Aneurinibacillus terranovensis]|uniref:ROK family glucokinase n=1 Tax=Aneurinibacillus terranovensis TaxID=278991 RepID=UPI000429B9B2|nr:ROK family glucokinase [Aneurinibacillus terranovensis]